MNFARVMHERRRLKEGDGQPHVEKRGSPVEKASEKQRSPIKKMLPNEGEVLDGS